jgi:outer membrane protein OmpA-like peptidoglycan-associated protein
VKAIPVLLAICLLCVPSPALAYPDGDALQKDIDLLEKSLQKAHAGQGPLCTPEALAAAQTCLAGVKQEFGEGDYWEAEDRLRICRREAEDIWNDILACGEDQDADGVPNRPDRCPTEPETYNGYQDEDGCPDRMPERAMLTGDRIEIIEPLGFNEQTHQLTSSSGPVLQEVARILRENPDVRLRVEVHLDNRLAPDQALRVSSLRAENLKSALVALGVGPDRVEAAGRGSEEPIAPNDSPFGRQVNSRVELVRLP